ncbi:MAG: isoprenylcysteine carboxylmethyltransferase family protein [Aquabacterium sp.]|nr:isoprenylcysteine carboxylmethyltransferase family protein [Aquabacterium sp.]
MRFLEHKIPPPVVGLLIGAGMWFIAASMPKLALGDLLRWAMAGWLIAGGLSITLLGGWAFRRAQTTVNPLKPEAASTLVVAGIYRYTRNPMYVGFAMVLIGWAAYLSSPPALLGPALFVLFITRFQIVPEERVLSVKFGQQFAAYKVQVRRWL